MAHALALNRDTKSIRKLNGRHIDLARSGDGWIGLIGQLKAQMDLIEMDISQITLQGLAIGSAKALNGPSA
jgi:hypothetical protein